MQALDSVQGATQAVKKLTSSRILPSPVQLTRVDGLHDSDNVDTLTLHDILGDPLIRESLLVIRAKGLIMRIQYAVLG